MTLDPRICPDDAASDKSRDVFSLTLQKSSSPGRLLFSEEHWNSICASLKLSPRECEIVKQIFDDFKETSIANSLGISPHTVHTYLNRLYHKLSVHSRESLIVRVVSVAQNGAPPCIASSSQVNQDSD